MLFIGFILLSESGRGTTSRDAARLIWVVSNQYFAVREEKRPSRDDDDEVDGAVADERFG
jgi:hypothetical protein